MTKKPNNLRILPQSLDAEKAILGSIMIRPSSVYEIADIISHEMFYAEKHKIIYREMMGLSAQNEPIDLVTVGERLAEKNLIDSVGGRSYLSEMVGTVPASTNIKYYADLVLNKFLARAIIEAADHICELGFQEGSMHIDEILDAAEKKIFAITNAPKNQKFTNIKNALAETWEQLEKLHASKDEIRGVPTGYRDLDMLTAGFQKSDLIILAARPSMGKTTLALDIARKAAVDNNIPVGIFSLEMSSQQLVQRMLSAQSSVNAWNIRTGKGLKDHDFQMISQSLDLLSKAPIYIDDQAGNNITKMRAAARRLKAEYGLGLIIIDYLQLMTTNKNYDSMVNQVTEISRSLKSLARELDVPVIALSQLSRAVEQRGGRPRLSDLRDSGSIEQDADLVMFIHNEDRMKEHSERSNITEILVEKHRNGPVGKVELYFDSAKTTFLDIEKSNMADFVPVNVGSGDSLEDF
jgi:replicative DNA helicase